MTGGMIWPPVEAIASTDAENSPEYPTFFIRGMVKAPVVTTLAGALPLIMPRRPLAKMETFAGPPGERPATLMEKLLKSWESPVVPRNAPKRIKRKI